MIVRAIAARATSRAARSRRWCSPPIAADACDESRGRARRRRVRARRTAAGRIAPCRADVRAQDWASLADVEVQLEALAIDDVDVPLGGRLAWRDTAEIAGACDQPVIERAALALDIRVDVALPWSGWRQLHAMAERAIVIPLVIQVDSM